MSELTRRDFLKTTGAVAAGAVLGLGLGEAPPESQAQTAGDGGGGKQSAGSVLSLPKGGGAVQGIGETFSPNPFTGTANFTVPIATSPGRSGFGPELSLQYSSGNGNGPFGLGWALSVPQISLKTERGIPQYQGKDTYLLSGAEDLVLHDQYPPVETEQKDYLITTYRPRVEGLFARIQHWKKIGGPADDQHFSPEFWRITTKDNITNLYGRTPQALLRHPDDPSRIYQWFLQLTHDMKGNYVHYEYLADNATDLPNKPYEEHRRKDQQQRGKNPRTWQVYLKCIRYGNIVPLASLDQQTVDAQLADLEQKAQDPTQHFKEHFFEVVFDYGDHGKRDPIPVPDEEKKDCLQGEAEGPAHQEITADIYAAKPSIPYRCDPFSSYRAGFEIRTYRRCHRVLMFHNGIPGESGPVLVKSTDFQYQADPYTNVSCLKSVTQRGYRKVKNSSAGTWYDSEELSLPNSQMPGARSQHYHIASFPPVEFGYTSFTPNNQKFRPFEAVGGDLPPRSLADPTFALVDVYGTGLPDVLHTMPNAYYVWRNLGNGQFDMRRPLKDQPAGVTLDQEGVGFGDMAGDGRADLLVHQGSHWHFYEATHRGGWKKAHFYERQPSFSLSDPNVKMVDLTGDGKSDVLRAEDSHFAWFPCLGEEGFGERKIFRRQHSLEDFPDVFFNDPRVRLIDLNGDGLTDIALIHDGRIDYWPNLGHGRWGARVTMENTPQFGPNFDPRRLLFADIDGSGPSDMVYVESDQVKFWLNQSGNAWSQEQVIHGTPQVTDLDSLEIADMFGTGTSGILYSTDYRGLGRSNYWYLDLTGGVKPYVLTEMTNNLGSTTRAEYSTSTQEYLQDLQENRPWITTLPFPVKVLKKVEVIDHIGKSKLVTTYRYHHGYYDGREREFRGFERVDQTDSEIFKDFAGSTLHEKQEALANVNEAFHVPPIHTKTWFHTGLFYEEDITTPLGNTFNTEYLLEYYREEYYEKDPLAFRFSSNEALEPGGGATVPALHLAYRALRGSVLRTEVYAQDGSDKEKHPYTVTESRFQVRKLQDPKPLADGRLQDGVFFPYKKETLTYHYERNPLDPRIAHDVTLQVDAYGQVTHAASWVYPRRPELQATGQLAQGSFKRDSALKEYQEQSQFLGTLTHKRVINPPALSPNLHTPTSDAEWAELSKRVLHDPWFVGVPYETQKCEIHHLHWDWACYIQGFFGDSGYGCGYEGRQPFSAAGLEALVLNSDGTPKAVLPFIGFKGTIPEARLPVLRLIDWSQTYFRTNREPEALTAPQNTDHRLPLGHIDSLALPFESYQAVFPKTFLTDQEVGFPFTDSNDSQLLALLAKGGYVTLMPIGEGTREDDYWWIPSGRQAFCPNKFYQPIQSQDPFGNNTTLYYDGDPLPSEDPPAHEQEASPLCPSPSGPNYWLLVQATKDPLGNIVRAVNDYVVLQPKAIIDPNDNHSEVAFDALGLVVGTAVKGKVKPQSPGEPENTEGDSLEGFTPYLTKEQLEALANPDDPTALARRLLRKASTRLIYDLWRPLRSVLEGGTHIDHIQPAWVGTIAREVHASVDAGPEVPIQFSVTYSDGVGREIQTKAQVEPGPLHLTDTQAPRIETRWLGSGWTIFNNKGKPVQQFEPFFAADHTYTHANTQGVSSILLYDSLERVMATLHPNHTYEKVVFDPWCQETWDTNDTILCGKPQEEMSSPDALDPANDEHVGKWFSEFPPTLYLPTWFHTRINEDLAKEKWPDTDEKGHPISHHAPRRQSEKRAAQQTLAHAATPTITHLDTFGRAFLTIADNGKKFGETTKERFQTYTAFDIQGNDLTIRDPRGVEAFLHTVDMTGRKLAIKSVDAGPKWLVPDVAGNPMWSKDGVEHIVTLDYDALRRPTFTWVQSPNEPAPYLAEAKVYGEEKGKATNHRGQLWKSYDGAGLVENQAYDFKGNLTHTTRILLKDPTQQVQWKSNTGNDSPSMADGRVPSPLIDTEEEEKTLDRSLAFTLTTKFDALNRVVERIEPDGVTKKTPAYNKRNLLQSLDVTETTGVRKFVERVTYNEKGQRTYIVYGNKVQSRYVYDPETFRLIALITECREGKDHDRLQKLHYTYDPVGNITHIHDGAVPAKWYDQATISAESYYGYDPTYRLVLGTGREHKANGFDVSSDVTAFKQSHFIPFSPPTTDGQALQMYTETFEYDFGGNLVRLAHFRGATTDPTRLLNQSPLWTRNQLVDWEEGKNYPGPDSPPRNNRLAFSRPGSSSPVPGEKPDFAYDANGNMAKLNDTLGTLQWDYKNQFIGVNLNKAGDQAVYQYDSAGQRVRKWVKKSGTIEERIYLGEFEIFTRRSNAEHVKWHVLHVMDDQARVALVESKVESNGSPMQAVPIYRYQLTNHLGSSVREVDETENAHPISIEDYYPYGGTSYIAGRTETDVSLKRYRYSGKERDDETGLYYYGARYYVPWLGRWVSSDPVLLEGGLNLFSFVFNSPIGLKDEMGFNASENNNFQPGYVNNEEFKQEVGINLNKEDAPLGVPRTNITFKDGTEFNGSVDSTSKSKESAFSQSVDDLPSKQQVSEGMADPAAPASISSQAFSHIPLPSKLTVQKEENLSESHFGIIYQEGASYPDESIIWVPLGDVKGTKIPLPPPTGPTIVPYNGPSLAAMPMPSPDDVPMGPGLPSKNEFLMWMETGNLIRSNPMSAILSIRGRSLAEKYNLAKLGESMWGMMSIVPVVKGAGAHSGGSPLTPSWMHEPGPTSKVMESLPKPPDGKLSQYPGFRNWWGPEYSR